jgi:hypothetical protein
MVHRNRKVVGATAAKVGLSRTEIVVRGAFLSKPEVLGNVITVEGKLFAPLWRSCPVLNKFLTPQSSCLRPLKDVAIFEILREKRKAVHLTLLDRGRVEDEEAEVDPADALGLDAPEAPKHKKRDRCRARASISKALLDSSAKYVPLAVDRGGHEPWCPCVLLGDRSHSIAMEATQTNFHMLWTVVQEDKAAFVPEATALRQPLRAEFSPRTACVSNSTRVRNRDVRWRAGRFQLGSSWNGNFAKKDLRFQLNLSWKQRCPRASCPFPTRHELEMATLPVNACVTNST